MIGKVVTRLWMTTKTTEFFKLGQRETDLPHLAYCFIVPSVRYAFHEMPMKWGCGQNVAISESQK